MLSTLAPLAWQGWATLAVVAITLLCLLWERWSPDRIMVGALVALVVSGILAPARALSGFWNPGVLTVGLLFVVVAALRSTGAIAWIGQVVIGRGRGLPGVLARVSSISAMCSAFVNNTPLVATMTSALEHWARRHRMPLSRLLLPMNHATILGGMCTMLGTSTNLVVGGLVVQAGLPKLDLFAPLASALPALVVGLLFLVTVGYRLLPVRRSAVDQAAGDTREFAVEMLVRAEGPLPGRSVAQAGLRRLDATFLVELHRAGRLLPAVGPDEVLHAGDRLVFVGASDGVRELRRIDGLEHALDREFAVDAAGGRVMIEVVLSAYSPAVGKSLREARFRERYLASVLAISRNGKRIPGKLGEVELQVGDTLLAEADGSALPVLQGSGDFLVVNLIDDAAPVVDRPRAIAALLVLLGMVLANAFVGVDLLWSAASAALLLVLGRCVRLQDLRRSADWRLLVVIASSFALGAAAQDTGLAGAAAALLGHWAGADPFWTLVLLYVATVIFTELLSNNAAAVLMFPVALGAAAQLGVSPMPFVMAIMLGASAGFITPIGYQTNLMVYGPGGYRFTDYLRLGVPLSLLVGGAVIWGISRAWAF